jgi:ankyrin repeat protein
VLSVKQEKSQALKSIITCNANLDTLDSNGWTALIHAAYHGDLESAKILIASGAKVNSYSN